MDHGYAHRRTGARNQRVNCLLLSPFLVDEAAVFHGSTLKGGQIMLGTKHNKQALSDFIAKKEKKDKKKTWKLIKLLIVIGRLIYKFLEFFISD